MHLTKPALSWKKQACFSYLESHLTESVTFFRKEEHCSLSVLMSCMLSWSLLSSSSWSHLFFLHLSFLSVDTCISPPFSLIPALYLFNYSSLISQSSFSLPFVLLKFHPYPISQCLCLICLCLVTCLFGVSVLFSWSTADCRTSLPSNINMSQQLWCHIHAPPPVRQHVSIWQWLPK